MLFLTTRRTSRFRRLPSTLTRFITAATNRTMNGIHFSNRVKRGHMKLGRGTMIPDLQNRIKGITVARMRLTTILFLRTNSTTRRDNFTTAQQPRRTRRLANNSIRQGVIRHNGHARTFLRTARFRQHTKINRNDYIQIIRKRASSDE